MSESPQPAQQPAVNPPQPETPTQQPAPAKTRWSWRKRLIVAGAILLAIIGVVVGPWPADNTYWEETDWGKSTRERIKTLKPLAASGKLSIGLARVPIDPEPGQPLMGYSDRTPLASEGVLTPCEAKALTLRCADAAVTIVSVDALLVLDDLMDEVIRRSGLRPEELYFTATHTHSGPGGWARGVIEEFCYGKFEQRYFDRLAEQIVSAIAASRKDTRPATLEYVCADAPEWLENRIFPGRLCLSTLPALIFKDEQSGKIRSILTAFSAHATVLRRENHRSSADYPGYLCAELEKATGAELALFAAGGIGDARPKTSGEEGAKKMGVALADKIIRQFTRSTPLRSNQLVSQRLIVDLPKARFALGLDAKVFPLVSPMFFSRQTHLSVLRIGEGVLTGWPADVAGEVAEPLQDWGQQESVALFLTSFNGNWRGYFTLPDTYGEVNTYETRMTGFLGPWAGHYFTTLTEELVKASLAVAPEKK